MTPIYQVDNVIEAHLLLNLLPAGDASDSVLIPV